MHPTATTSVRSRRVVRVVLRAPRPSAPGRWLSADRSPTGRAARAWTGDADAIQFEQATDHDAVVWQGKPTGLTGRRPCLRYDRRSATHRILLAFESGGGVSAAHTDDEGGVWTMATTISATGTFPTFCVTPTGAQHHFWVDSGAIRTTVVDATGATLVALRTVVGSGVADDAITAWHNADTGDLYLSYRNGSSAIVTVRSADDGLSFA